MKSIPSGHGGETAAQILIVALALGGGQAFGQAAPAQSTAAAPEGGLEEITVTARRRVESAQDVPVALTAISAETVERYDISSLEKLAAFNPEFNVGRASNGSGAEITLRGIGSQSTPIGLEQSTAVVVDGVYYGQGRVINEAFVDLGGLELLKGPQALFFGKNATAGVVNITTADPTDKWESMVRAGYEFNAQQLITEGFISGPIAPGLSFRLAANVSNMFGSLYNQRAVPTPLDTVDLATGAVTQREQLPSTGPFPGTVERVVRGTLKWEPTDQLKITLKAGFNISNDYSDAGNYVPMACANANGTTQTNPMVHCARDFDIYQPDAPSGFNGGGVIGTHANGQPYNDYKSDTLTGTLNYTLDKFAITSINNFNRNNNEWALGFNIESPTSFTTSHENTTYWSLSNENRLQTTFDGPINVMVGTYYQKSLRNYFQDGNFVDLTDSSAPAPFQDLAYTKLSQTKGETESGYGQLSWKIIPNLEVAAGARYTHETKDSFLEHPYIISALRTLFQQYDPANPAGTEVAANQTFNNTSPEVTISYKPMQDVMVYGAYKTAYKSGGFSNSAFVIVGAPASNIAFNPETAHGFETGIKTTLLDRQLRFNVSAYTFTYDNLQVDYFNSINFQFITTNAGAANTKGIETELEYAPREVQGLTLRGSLNYNRARYLNYIAPCYGGQSIQAGCTTTFLGGPGQDLSGQPTAVAPDVTASFGADYEIPLSGNMLLGISGNGRYSSAYLGSSFGEPLSRNPAYVNLDANIRVGSADHRWELALIGRNLTNAFYIGGVLDAPNSGTGTGTAHAVPADILGLANDPRTVRLQATFRFQ